MILENITPETIKRLSLGELNTLCDELRCTIHDTVMKCGGHLSSNLGTVESTVALFATFDFPKDKIVFDVGHQCYSYKLLSGRYNAFSTLRKENGLSGFPKRAESEYDCYDTGHAGTAISAALGIAKARDLKKEDSHVIAYVGDGSFNNGLVYEALTSLKILNTKILIVLNDNGMSISPTVGGMHDILAGLQANGTQRANNIALLESFGLTYVGVKDGNNCEEMLATFSTVKELLKEQSVLVHIQTKKGKGYEFSEDSPTLTHGMPSSAVKKSNEKEYSAVLGETLCSLAEKNSDFAVVCAAMLDSLGLAEFFKNYSERAFDVGICEENASVLCASMALSGIKTYYAIYSTFLQRAFDEIIHDVCAQDAPVTFCIDRAGITGADGETHQGVFDLSYLSMIPNLTVAVPKNLSEFSQMLKFSEKYNHPLAIRYPRSGNLDFCGQLNNLTPIEVGKWEILKKGSANLAIIATGERCLSIALRVAEFFEVQGYFIEVINARFVKPLDEEMLNGLQVKHIVTLEDNVYLGGFGATVCGYFMNNNRKDLEIKNFAYRDEFIPHGSVESLQKRFGVNEEEIKAYVADILL